MDNDVMVRTLGGLLRFLDQKRIGVELEDMAVSVPIVYVHTFSTAHMMVMDRAVFSSLQIFYRESHPSVHKAYGSGSREGLSLFGVMCRCRSGVGAKLLR